MVKKSPNPQPSTTANKPLGTSAPIRDQFAQCIQAIKDNQEAQLRTLISTRVREILTTHGLADYTALVLFDDFDSITNYHADQLYAAASKYPNGTTDILLMLHSKGGSVEPAYLISKALKRLAAKRFVVTVPRRAKSAATLLALGADEVHMGLMSQLGPIDPQFGGIPALALGNALDVIADLACRFPEASSMLTNYLAQEIPLRVLGYYQRVSESAVQYAERLLNGKEVGPGRSPEEVAKHLVNHYKDHSFVIDSDEATQLLGNSIVKENTPEYKAGDEIFKFINMLSVFLDIHGKQWWYIGTPESGFHTREKPSEKN